MSSNSNIEWTDATWNPVTGCSKVSQGCKFCYAEREWRRISANPLAKRYFGREFTDVQCHYELLDLPLHWKISKRIFVNSMSDLFHSKVPNHFIFEVFLTMWKAKQHTFQILTKRPDSMFTFMVDVINNPSCKPVIDLPNVWLGTSAEDQQTLDERIMWLRETPAAVRFLSLEPLLDAIWLPDGFEKYIHWVIVGGESGSHARPMDPHWVMLLQAQCAEAGVPFFFKQWGEWLPKSQSHDIAITGRERFMESEDQSEMFIRVGKKTAGRILNAKEFNELPHSVRENASIHSNTI